MATEVTIEEPETHRKDSPPCPPEFEEAIAALGARAKAAASALALVSTAQKNNALAAIAEALKAHEAEIISANEEDASSAHERGVRESLVDRLILNSKRIDAMIAATHDCIALPDPVGETVAGWTRPNGLVIQQVTVPLGVVGIIYESRPNVTVDAAVLCLKAGNAVILRGGSDAIHSNTALVEVMQDAVASVGLPGDSVLLVEDTRREAAEALMRATGYVDVLIPRGGAGLIETVVKTASVPVIETGAGNCHIFVDETADLEMANRIVFNAKTQRPGVCNAVETVLVHQAVAERFLPDMAKTLAEKKVELRGCERTRAILGDPVKPATEEDWATEYLDLILAVKVVDSVDEAIEHIDRYSTKHSEAIITERLDHARKFLAAVDSAAVYVNASTRFTDGGEFGLGAEIGISTQKLHARGPMGLRQLVSTKFIIYGDGQVR